MKNDEFVLRVSETVPDRASTHTGEQICEECGRPFFISSMDLWAYKITIKGHTLWFCRWNCVRAAERKIEAKKVGRTKTMNPNKPKKEVLEQDLRSGKDIVIIAKKYDCSCATINNWIKKYGLQGLKGVRNPKVEPDQDSTMPPTGRSRAPMTSGIAVTTQNEPPVIYPTPPDVDMVQHSPSLAEIEQFHTDNPVQELPKVEMDRVLAIDVTLGPDQTSGIDVKKVAEFYPPVNETRPESIASPDLVPALPFAEVWQNALEDLEALKRSYVTLAQQEFKDRLLEMVTYLAG